MGFFARAMDKLKDVAGGVRGARGEAGKQQAGHQPKEAKFDPEDARRRKKPKDDLPQPEDFRPQD